MNNTVDNPAARLYAILEEAKKLGEGQTCRDQWCKLLQVRGDDYPLFLSRYSKVIALAGETREAVIAVQRDPRKQGDYLRWAQRVHQAFTSQDFGKPWSTFTKPINDDTMAFLSNAADMLARETPPSYFTIEGVEGVSDQINQLIQSITDSDMENPLRGYLLQELHALKAAVDEYWLTGSGPIIRFAESTLAHLALSKEFRKPRKKNAAIIAGVLGLLVYISSFNDAVISSIEMVEKVREVIPAGMWPEQQLLEDRRSENALEHQQDTEPSADEDAVDGEPSTNDVKS